MMFDPYTQPLFDRDIAWDRKETDPCERNTVGCAVDHNKDDGDCEGW